MIHRAPHLQDDRIFDSYVAERHGEAIDPRVAEHLADCTACAARYTALRGFMDELGTAAEIESDTVFTPGRLRVQQQQIARRIEHVGRAARILSFPRHFSGERVRASSSRTPPRWVAATAAAALFIGAALGVTYEWERRHASARPPSATVQQVVAPRPVQPVQLVPATDGGVESPEATAADAFLSELELMLEPQTRELQAFDALTPHVLVVADLR